MRKQMVPLLVFAVACGAFPLAQAQPPSDSPAEYDPKKAQQEMEKVQKEMERMQQEAQKMQEVQMERLRQENPQAYQSQKTTLERQKKISDLMTAFHKGKIPASSAKSQLTPLIREEVKEEIEGLADRISRMERELQFLKRAKSG